MGRIEEALRKAKDKRDSDVGRRAAIDSRKSQGSRPDTSPEQAAPAVSHIPKSHIVKVDEEQLLEQRVIAGSESDERVGPYRQLRTQILKTMRDNQWTSLAITSANEKAGKSLTAANLAISLSKDVNTTVLLVDLDFTMPTIHEKLNLKVDKGLVDYLEGRAELEEILFDPGFERLTVLAGRSAGRYSSELLSSPKMLDLLQSLSKQDQTTLTIFDLPPLMRNDDAILFAPYADATLLVVEDGVTTDDQLEDAIRLLDKANVIGTILNKARA
jgi:protein-tyrosine kinase